MGSKSLFVLILVNITAILSRQQFQTIPDEKNNKMHKLQKQDIHKKFGITRKYVGRLSKYILYKQ